MARVLSGPLSSYLLASSTSLGILPGKEKAEDWWICYLCGRKNGPAATSWTALCSTCKRPRTPDWLFLEDSKSSPISLGTLMEYAAPLSASASRNGGMKTSTFPWAIVTSIDILNQHLTLLLLHRQEAEREGPTKDEANIGKEDGERPKSLEPNQEAIEDIRKKSLYSLEQVKVPSNKVKEQCKLLGVQNRDEAISLFSLYGLCGQCLRSYRVQNTSAFLSTEGGREKKKEQLAELRTQINTSGNMKEKAKKEKNYQAVLEWNEKLKALKLLEHSLKRQLEPVQSWCPHCGR